jgi:hypothetical protein
VLVLIALLAVATLRWIGWANDMEATVLRTRRSDSYPFTLIFENDSTAVPAVGRPIKSAG